jgi:DNA modification methylase
MNRVTLIEGDCREVMRGLAAGSVHAVVTSPPYWSLRNYNVAGQIGLERTVGEFVAAMVEVFEDVRRVLRDDGTLWLNMGDCYANDGKWGGATSGKHVAGLHGTTSIGRERRETGLKPKDLVQMPARVAIALQDAGWYLRSEIVWAKKAPMPESVTDRPTSSHEKIFLFAKSERYFYDAEAVRETAVSTAPSGNGYGRPEQISRGGRGQSEPRVPTGSGRNLRNFWLLGPEPFPEAHFATFPSEVPRRAILAATSERGCCPACLAPCRRIVEPSEAYAALLGKDWADYDADEAEGRGHFALADGSRSSQRCVKRNAPSVTAEYVTKGWQASCACDAGEPVPAVVLDPFAGAGTTAMVAAKLGRDSIGAELNPDYIAIAERRITREVGPLVCRVDVRRKEQAS